MNKYTPPLRIRLIAPRMELRPMDSTYKRRMAPSLSLLTVAALTPPPHIVTIEDENIRPIDLDEPADLVGMTINVHTAYRAYALAKAFRKRGVPVVLGGIHASAVPEEAERHAEAVCVGEAEDIWPRILDDAVRGDFRGIYQSDGPADLSRAPLPRRDLLPENDYLYSNIVSASRGCPFACDFCYNSCAYAIHGHRTRPVSQVVDDIRALKLRHVMFIDDNLIGNLPWARELLAALQPLHLTWHAAVSANIGEHPGLLDAMAESGCKSLFIGFESVNPAVLRAIHKRQNRAESYGRTISAIHERGMMVNASLVFGFDGDTAAVFPETLDWLVAHRVESMTAHILTPYPGTRLFAQMKAAGRITDWNWSHYDTARVVFRPESMSADELEQGYRWIYRNFYSLGNIMRRMPAPGPRRIPFLIFNLGYRKFGALTAPLMRGRLMGVMGKVARRVAYGAA